MGQAILGADIHTMVEPSARATAMAWHEDTLVAVGDDDSIRRLAEAQDWPIETLDGQTIIPGFVDCHMHFLHVGIKRARPDLRGAQSKEEALQRVSDWLAANPGEEPATGEGWDEADWSDRDPAVEPLTKEDLDAISPERPLVLRRICGHKAVANSTALPAIQERFDTGVDAESGVLLEQPSLYLNEVLPIGPETLQSALRLACDTAHRLGVTALGNYEQAPMRQALIDAAAAGTLDVRVFCSIYVQFLEDAIAEGFQTGRHLPGPQGPSPFLRDGGLKVFLDGSLGGHTAHMRCKYHDRETHGLAVWDDDEVDRWFQTASEAEIQIHAHAIGDAAIDQGLQAYEAIGSRHLRHRFEHFEIAHDEHIEACRRLAIHAGCQPNFVGEWSSKGGMYEARIGDVYTLNNRFRTFTDEGLDFAFSSDGMPFGPLYGLQSAIQHPVEKERLFLDEAVYRYTHAAAKTLHWEHEIGSLAMGKKADFLILDGHSGDAPSSWIFSHVFVGGVLKCQNDQPFIDDDAVYQATLTAS